MSPPRQTSATVLFDSERPRSPDPTLKIELGVALHPVVQSAAEKSFRLKFVELLPTSPLFSLP